MNRKHRLALCATLFTLVPLAGCGGQAIESLWLDVAPPVIDGQLDRAVDHDEWLGSLLLLEDEHIHIGLLNDEEALYLCLATNNRDVQANILRRGFTLWFDVEGGDAKTFGYRFPAGANEAPPASRQEGRRDQQQPAARELIQLTDLMRDQETRPTSLDFMLAEVAYQRIQLSDVPGLELAVGAGGNVLCYEARIPFAAPGREAFVLAAAAGDEIGVGLETARPETSGMEGRPGFDMGGGMGGGMGGSPGGGMGGGPGGGQGGGPGGGDRRGPASPLEFWGRIRLAVSPTGTD